MNIISVPLFTYINIALSAGFILLTLIYRSENNQFLVTIIPFIIIAINGYLISLKTKVTENIIKNVVLGGFIGSILIAFAPYIFQYTANKPLYFGSLIFTIFILLNISIVKLKEDEKAKA